MVDFVKSIPELRARVPVTQQWAYFETASTGLVPDFVYDGVRRYMDARYHIGGNSVWEFPDTSVETLEMMQRSKAALGEMIHGAPDRITFGQSSTQLFTMVTEAVEYGPEDNVVAVDRGWIGNRFAWQKRQDEGLEVRYAVPENGAVTPEQLMTLCDEHTRAVTVNLVESKTGYRIDMDRLSQMCRKRGLLLFVDGVQALGALQVDVERWGVDLLVGNDYKWMMNFCGTGYAYISRRLQPLIRHWGAGWMSDDDGGEPRCTGAAQPLGPEAGVLPFDPQLWQLPPCRRHLWVGFDGRAVRHAERGRGGAVRLWSGGLFHRQAGPDPVAASGLRLPCGEPLPDRVYQGCGGLSRHR